MNSIVPSAISRETMQQLKKLSEQKKHSENIRAFVSDIYHNAVYIAKNTDEKFYKYPIPRDEKIYNRWYLKHIDEILQEIQKLFPDCSVSNSILNEEDENSYIIVDWS